MIRQDTMNKDYRTIVVGGAGSNIYAYLGVFEVLFDDADFKQGGAFEKIKNFIGTSAGALIAAMLAVGADLTYFKAKMDQINLSMLADHSVFIPTNVYRLCTSFGYNKGDAVLKLVEDMLEELTGDRDITLQGLYEFKDRKINFVATGCNVSKRQLRFFNRLTDPDMKVSHAVRVSISIPLFFEAFNYQGDLYVDGSVMASVPLDFATTDMFKLLNEYDPDIIGIEVPEQDRLTVNEADRNLYDLVRDNDEKSKSFIYIMNRTVGMKTYTPKQLKFLNPDEEGGDNPSIKSFTLISYITQLFGLVLDSIEKFHIDEKYWTRLCKINVNDMSSINFNISAADKATLIECGRKGAQAWLDTNNIITANGNTSGKVDDLADTRNGSDNDSDNDTDDVSDNSSNNESDQINPTFDPIPESTTGTSETINSSDQNTIISTFVGPALIGDLFKDE